MLIYPDRTRKPWYYFKATPQLKDQLFFNGQFIKVYFLGSIVGETINIVSFVRTSEWM